MNSEELKKRTKEFALQIIQLVEKFHKSKTRDVIGRQLILRTAKKDIERYAPATCTKKTLISRYWQILLCHCRHLQNKVK